MSDHRGDPGESCDLSTLLMRCLVGRGDHVALRSGASVWSYAELDGATRERAYALRARVREGGRVVLVGTHSAEALIWALAVMRSGLVYIPVSPEVPPQRLHEALQVAAPDLVVCCTDSALELVTGLVPEAAVMSVAAPAPPPDADLPAVWSATEVAYSIFTSGSSGRAKLVEVGHRGIEALCRAQTRLFGLGPGVRVVQFSSLSFDASVAEILVTLFAGAVLEVPVATGSSWVSALAHHLHHQGCDVVTLPPSVYARLDEQACRAIGTVVFAGEALPQVEYDRASRVSRVLNAYGPTEGTVCFSVAELAEFTTSVGRPIDGYRALVHDAARDSYAESGRGELVIVGAGVALGYRGTASGVLPFTTIDGVPAYHTGDEVQLLDGEVHYEGRIDDQIKRLGHRVMVTDLQNRISAVLQVPCVVLLDGDVVVLAYTGDLDERRVTRECRAALAPWERPDQVVCVDAIPLTVAGKADREALAQWAQSARSSGPGDGQQESDLQIVQGIVEGVLGASIAPDMSIFDAGGTSFSIVRIQVELAQRYGDDLVQHALDSMDYDFTVAGFLAALHGRTTTVATREITAAVLADLARLAPAGQGSGSGRTVVTGAGGFIGGHVLERLLTAGSAITVVSGSDPDTVVRHHCSRFGRTPRDLSGIEFRGYDELDRGSSEWGLVVHCGFDVNHLLPLARQVKTSIASTRAMVIAAALHRADRFVLLSAASAGARFDSPTIDVLDGIPDPYSQAKRLSEAYAETLEGPGCTVDLLRAGLVYGHLPTERHLLDRDVFATLLRLSARHATFPRLAGSVPVCHVEDVITALLDGAAGPARREVLIARTYDQDSLQAETGFAGAETVDPGEWLALVAGSGAVSDSMLAALRLWLSDEAGWHQHVSTDDRPIARHLLETMGEAQWTG